MMKQGNKFEFPFRVGRKQKRAVLDAHGREVVVFPRGCEDMALEYATIANTVEAMRLKAMNRKVENPISFCTPVRVPIIPKMVRLNRDFLRDYIKQEE